MSTVRDRAIATVLEHEGGYVDDPDDPGGVTAYGISLRYLRLLGELGDLDHDGDVDADDVRTLIGHPERAAEIYGRWWDAGPYPAIAELDEEVAIKIFDLAVNAGDRAAGRILQRALRSVLDGPSLIDDGIVGPNTLLVLKAMRPWHQGVAILEAAIRSEAAGFYRVLVALKPAREKWLRGWLNRAYS